MKVTRTDVEVEGDKRMHIPFAISDECPGCNAEVAIDYSKDQYLSYPRLDGESTEISFYCDDCEEEWQKEIVLVLTVEQLTRK